MNCPKCGHSMAVDQGFVTWCDQCHWNLDPHAGEISKADRGWERLNVWLGTRNNAALFDELIKGRKGGLQPFIVRCLAYGFATIWYLLFFWIAYQAAITLYAFRSLLDLLIGLFLALLTWVLIPRFYRLKEPILDRGQYPALYETVDQIISFLGAKPIDGIVLDYNFNAAYARSGLRGKKLLVIGLPWFAALTGKEKVAIIAHEMGHHANRDITRSAFLGGVQQQLSRLYYGLYPQSDLSLLLAFVDTWIAWFRKFLAFPVMLLWYGIGFTIWRDSQRAEYAADYAAASVAGADSIVSALKKLCYAPTFYKTWEMAAQYQHTFRLFDEFRGRYRSMPEREVERIRLLNDRTENSLESSHPPTRYRLSYLWEKAPRTSGIIAEETIRRMEAEFSELEALWEKRMLTDYRSYLYNR